MALLRKRVAEWQRHADEELVDKYVESCARLDADLISAIERSHALNRMEILAGWEQSNFDSLTALRRQLQPYAGAFSTAILLSAARWCR